MTSRPRSVPMGSRRQTPMSARPGDGHRAQSATPSRHQPLHAIKGRSRGGRSAARHRVDRPHRNVHSMTRRRVGNGRDLGVRSHDLIDHEMVRHHVHGDEHQQRDPGVRAPSARAVVSTGSVRARSAISHSPRGASRPARIAPMMSDQKAPSDDPRDPVPIGTRPIQAVEQQTEEQQHVRPRNTGAAASGSRAARSPRRGHREHREMEMSERETQRREPDEENAQHRVLRPARRTAVAPATSQHRCALRAHQIASVVVPPLRPSPPPSGSAGAP
jgi:hypothetical protein